MKMKPADWTLSLRTVSSLNYLHNWLDSQMPSSLSCWPGGGAGLQVFKDSWIREQRSVDTGPAVWGKCIPGIWVMWQLELRVHRVKQWGELPSDQRSVMLPGGADVMSVGGGLTNASGAWRCHTYNGIFSGLLSKLDNYTSWPWHKETRKTSIY